MTYRKPRKVRAWLVTWEWSGDHAKVDDRVAAAFDSRLLPERVRGFVEILYAQQMYTLSEKIASFVGNHRRNPYPAEFLKIEGVPCEGEIHCGANPWLRARLVDDLTVERGEDGKETATWEDRYIVRRSLERIKALLAGGQL